MKIPTLWAIDNAGWAVLWVETQMGAPDRVWCIAQDSEGNVFKDDTHTPQWFLYHHQRDAEKALKEWQDSDEFEDGCDFKVCRVQMAAVATEVQE